MNLIQAEAIAALSQELIEAIPRDRISLPAKMYPSQRWSLDDISHIEIEDGQLKISWSRYAGCGETDRDETYESLSNLFD